MTSQKDNVVGGHQAGRDVNAPTLILNSHPVKTFMTALRERFEYERAHNSEFHDVVESLKYYCDPIDAKPTTLETKLELGHRSSEIPEALRAKELTVKLMARHSLSEAAQLVIAWCLGDVRARFKAKVSPMINEGASHDVINAAIFECVAQPVFEVLGENFLSLTPQDLGGMIYFLTANCFLNWHVEKENARLPPSA